MTNLSRFFTLEEFTASQTAARRGIKNTPDKRHIENMRYLCAHVLEPIRRWTKKPVVISSGYRSVELNQAIGGSRSSHHCRGMAADFTVPSVHNHTIVDFLRAAELPFTQLIDEYGRWLHVSFDRDDLKCQELTARRINGKTTYLAGIQTKPRRIPINLPKNDLRQEVWSDNDGDGASGD